jgi:hypothetical protein
MLAASQISLGSLLLVNHPVYFSIKELPIKNMFLLLGIFSTRYFVFQYTQSFINVSNFPFLDLFIPRAVIFILKFTTSY